MYRNWDKWFRSVDNVLKRWNIYYSLENLLTFIKTVLILKVICDVISN